MYPAPYARAADNARLALAAEALGFDSVWGNDHVSTQRYVRAESQRPPSFYSLPVVLAHIAGLTSRIRLGTALLVLPFRHPVVTAKELATLDQLSGGRVIAGVGIGAYREEFEAMFADRRSVHRGAMLDEGIAALRLLFAERSATFEGRYYRFRDVESYPKPVQDPLPIYPGGNSAEGRMRAGHYGEGWLPAVLSPEDARRGAEEVWRAAEEAGRDPHAIDIAPQLVVSVGRTRHEALARFERSQLYQHLVSLQRSTLRGQDPRDYPRRSLIGSASELVEQVERYREAGVTTLAALLFACTTIEETLEQMQQFSEEVMRHFTEAPMS